MENLCTTFEGLGYDAIVMALLERWGIYGEPAEGNRNTVLYRLAREMRYICDFSAQRLMAVIPRWGLGEEECRHTIASALASPRGTQLPADVRAVLSALKGEGGDVSAQSSDLNPLPARLPFLLDFLVRRYPRNRRCVLLASLPVLGTLLSRLRSPSPLGVLCTHTMSSSSTLSRKLSQSSSGVLMPGNPICLMWSMSRAQRPFGCAFASVRLPSLKVACQQMPGSSPFALSSAPSSSRRA